MPAPRASCASPASSASSTCCSTWRRSRFGASSGQGGLGWYIFQNRNELYTDKVFARLATVVLIGLVVDGLVFDALERVTVRRWGMQR